MVNKSSQERPHLITNHSTNVCRRRTRFALCGIDFQHWQNARSSTVGRVERRIADKAVSLLDELLALQLCGVALLELGHDDRLLPVRLH